MKLMKLKLVKLTIKNAIAKAIAKASRKREYARKMAAAGFNRRAIKSFLRSKTPWKWEAMDDLLLHVQQLLDRDLEGTIECPPEWIS